MVLDLKGVPNILFDNSRIENLGIAADEKNITTAAVKSFIIGGPSEQYDCTANFAEVTGMKVTHESKTGKVLVIFSCNAQPGVSEAVYTKLQKDGVDVPGTEQRAYVNFSSEAHVWSYPGTGFLTWEPRVDQIINDSDNGVFMVLSGSSVAASAPVMIPDGAIVTEVSVQGLGTWNWRLYRDTLKGTGSPTIMASGTRDSTDTSITVPTINNTYKYWIQVYSLDTDETIGGAAITYTPAPFKAQDEGPWIPLSIHVVETNAEKNVWRIMAKSTVFRDDSMINDRIISVIDI